MYKTSPLYTMRFSTLLITSWTFSCLELLVQSGVGNCKTGDTSTPGPPTLCFHETRGKKTHINAMKACIDYGATLTMLHPVHGSRSEAETPSWMPVDPRYMTYDDIWVGLTFTREGRWEWIDGTPLMLDWDVVWSPWKQGHPSRDVHKRCVTVNKQEKFETVDCTEERNYICEYRVCAGGWMYNPHTARCVKYNGVQVTYQDAAKECHSHSAIVEVFKTEHSINTLLNTIRPPALRASSNKASIHLGIVKNSDDKWLWNDGGEDSLRSHNKWCKLRSNAHCHSQYGGNLLNDYHCPNVRLLVGLSDSNNTWCRSNPTHSEDKAHFVCSQVECRWPWLPRPVVAGSSQKICLLAITATVFRKIGQNALQSNEICARFGGYLPMPKTKEQRTGLKEFVVRYLPHVKHVWIGMSGEVEISDTYIPFHTTSGQYWRWSDGHPLQKDNDVMDFFSQRGVFSKLEQVRACAALAPNGSVLQMRCTEYNANGFVCEKNPPHMKFKCDSLPNFGRSIMNRAYWYWHYWDFGSESIGSVYDTCFLTIDRPMIFPLAYRTCSKIGGYVAMAKTVRKKKALIHRGQTTWGSVAQWLGADDIADEDIFYWNDGTSMQDGEYLPVNRSSKDRHDCVEIMHLYKNDGTLTVKSISCFESRNFLCEVRADYTMIQRRFFNSVACAYPQYGIQKWDAHGSFCYMNFRIAKTFWQASMYCLYYGATLVKPKSRFQTRAAALSNSPMNDDFWIGAHVRDGGWFWHSSTFQHEDKVYSCEMRFDKAFFTTAIRNDCVNANSHSDWKNISCGDTSYYTCQKRSLIYQGRRPNSCGLANRPSEHTLTRRDTSSKLKARDMSIARKTGSSLNLGRLIGSHDSTIESFPWIVYIITYYGNNVRPFSANNDYGNKHAKCGGSILSRRYVLTAAHCIDFNWKRIDVWIGTSFVTPAYNLNLPRPEFTSPLQYRYKVSKVVKHPLYQPGGINDIAVIELETEIPLDRCFGNVCLPPQGQSIGDWRTFGHCKVGGYGKGSGKTLNIVRMERIANIACFSAGTDDLCFWAVDDVAGAACRGDSGGPLVCLSPAGTWVQHGIVSRVTESLGNKECTPTVKMIFTKVASYVSWINSITGQEYAERSWASQNNIPKYMMAALALLVVSL